MLPDPNTNPLNNDYQDEATMTSKWPTPKRGSKSRLNGVFMGGGAFKDQYELKKRALFKTSFQIRGPKAMQSAQNVLFDLKTDDSKI